MFWALVSLSAMRGSDGSFVGCREEPSGCGPARLCDVYVVSCMESCPAREKSHRMQLPALLMSQDYGGEPPFSQL